ncbi:MAG: NAD(P)/FAD-dependent oxidoreductase [Eubacteriaceae bacterium]
MKKNNVIVVGGGPAGMIAAGTASMKEYNEVILIEKNEKLGKKLYITGKGRCNFTNACEIEELFDSTISNKSFLYSAFYSFSNYQTIQFFNDLGLEEKIERGNRVFPKSDKSSDVIKALEKYLKINDVNIKLKTTVKDVIVRNNKVYSIILDNQTEIKCDKLIIATGGLSYPQTGSTGDGYKWAKKLGHSIINTNAALVPLVSSDDFVVDLQGLSLKNVEVSLIKDKKVVNSYFGEMIFTHFGVSGPAILSLSSMIKDNNKYQIKINLKPSLDFNMLDKRILRDFEKYYNKDYKNALNDLLPKKMIPIIISLSRIDESKKVNQITKEERHRLINIIHNLTLNIKSKRPISEAIITSGGINTKEINPATMESKLINGLFFAGEIIDVDALTGGYNLQISFSTGYMSGNNC